MSDEPKPSHFWPPPEHPPEELLPDPTFKETFQRWWRRGLANWVFVVFVLLEFASITFVLGFLGAPDVMHEDGAVRHTLVMFREPPQHLFWYPVGLVSLVAGVLGTHVAFVKFARRWNWYPNVGGVATNGVALIFLGLILGWVGGTGERLVNSLWMISYRDRPAFMTIGAVGMSSLSRERKRVGEEILVMNFADGTKRALLADLRKGPIKRWDCVRYRERVGILGIPFVRRPLWRKTLTRIECPDSVEVLRIRQKAIFDSLMRPVVKPWYLE